MVDVAPGRYRLSVSGTSASVAGGDDIDIDGPSAIDVTPRTVSGHTVGVVMFASGLALLLGGVLLVGFDKPSERTDGCALCTGGAALGALAIAAGVTLIPVGIVLGSKTAPDVDVDRLAAARTAIPGAWRATGLALGGTF